MNRTGYKGYDSLQEFFTSEWSLSLSKEAFPAPSDFSAAVLNKIVKRERRKERLFYLACTSIALAGIAAIVLFVYPGYGELSGFMGNALAFSFPPWEFSAISTSLLLYLSLIAVIILGLDTLLRKRFGSESVS